MGKVVLSLRILWCVNCMLRPGIALDKLEIRIYWRYEIPDVLRARDIHRL